MCQLIHFIYLLPYTQLMKNSTFAEQEKIVAILLANSLTPLTPLYLVL